MIKINMPKSVKLIIKILEENGFEAYAVGGCVRDAVLGREPNDWDITTSAMPEDIKRIFNRTIDTGIRHGTVTVMIDRVGYEVTTYRIDGEYVDGRHPKTVEFTGSLIEDLKRRDFTINAMAYNDRAGIVDEFDGTGDLERRVIKCVGNPEDRFNEDALRILRAVRFAAALDFEIENTTRTAIIELADNLSKISRERIQAELEKLFMSRHPERLRCAYETGITSVIFKEIDRVAEMNMLEGALQLTCEMPREHYLRWAAVLAMSDRSSCAKILKEFKFDNKTVNIVSRIVGALDRELPQSRAQIRRDIYEIGEDIYEKYLAFMKIYLGSECMEMRTGRRLNRSKDTEKTWDWNSYYAFISGEYKDILEKGECISLKKLAVNGKDLIEIGMSRGQQVGDTLVKLLYKVMEDSSLNEKEKLLDMVR